MSDSSFCENCGNRLEANSNFCSKCGTNVSSSLNEKQTNKNYEKPTKKGRSKKQKLGIGFGVFILIVFVLGGLASAGFESTEKELKNPELTPTQIKDQAIRGLSFDDLMRNNERYVGDILYVEGKVIQSQNIYGDTYALRVSITKEDLGFGTEYYKDPIYVNYAGERILEGDIVGIHGRVVGIKEYTAVLGNQVELPEVDSLLLEVVKKGD
jgi:hypothetical protein